jgi:ABC-type multidrug transport system ATPase subunit
MAPAAAAGANLSNAAVYSQPHFAARPHTLEMTETAVAFDEVTVTCGRRHLVDRLSFVIPAGRVTGILGPNGSGKTTTLRLLAGLVRPSTGSITVFDQDRHAATETLRRAVAMVPERDGLNDDLTVNDTLKSTAEMWAEPGSAPGGSAVGEVLSQLDLQDRADDWCGTLSAGLRRRVAIGRALIVQPKLLLLDEVTNSLDLPSRTDFYDWLESRRASAPALTIILATHNAWEASSLCDHYVVLAKGRAVFCGPRAELVPNEADATAFEKAVVELMRA